MSLLLDTSVLLWWFGGADNLGRDVRAALADVSVPVHVSAASVWEIAIKSAIGKLRRPVDDLETAIVEEGFSALPISVAHAEAAGALPLHHRDPFDRMLVAQARSEGLTLVTADRRIAAYEVATLLV